MWRSIQQLIDVLRRGRQGRVAETPRTARLGIETLENRTVLSANFGVDLEAVAFHEFNAPPQPRILFHYEASAAVDGSERPASSSFAERHAQFQAGNGEAYLTAMFMRFGPRPDAERLLIKGGQGFDLRGEQTAGFAGGLSLEDKAIGSAEPSVKGPLKSQSQTPADNDAGPKDSFQNALPSNFDSPRLPALTTLLERIAETRRVATSPFPALIVTTAAGDASAIDTRSLLANYATLAASLENDDDFSATSRDAAFDGYAPARNADAGSDEYVRLLAENQTRDAAADAGGFVELDEASVTDGQRRSTLLADAQRDAIESALRALAARRGDARTSRMPENWLEQASPSVEIAQQEDANGEQVADEPGGMILLPPMTDSAGEELISAGDMSEAVKTAVEMEAAIGTYQAFDVSIDEASTGVVKPASAQELGGQQDREEPRSEWEVERRTASGAGVFSLGVMAFAAKRKIENRKRSKR